MNFTRNTSITHTDYNGTLFTLPINTPRFHNNRIVENLFDTLTPTFYNFNSTPVGNITNTTYLDESCYKIEINNVNVGVQQPILLDNTLYAFTNTNTSFRFSIVLSRDLNVGEQINIYFNNSKQGSHIVSFNETKSPSTSFNDFGGIYYVNNSAGDYGFYIESTLNSNIDIYIKDIFFSDDMNYISEYVETIKTFPYLSDITTVEDRIYTNYGKRFSSNGVLVDNTIETLTQPINLSNPFSLYLNITPHEDVNVLLDDILLYSIIGNDSLPKVKIYTGTTNSITEIGGVLSIYIDKGLLDVDSKNKIMLSINNTTLNIAVNAIFTTHTITPITNLINSCTVKIGGETSINNIECYYGELMVYNVAYNEDMLVKLTNSTKFAYEPLRIGNMEVGNNFSA